MGKVSVTAANVHGLVLVVVASLTNQMELSLCSMALHLRFANHPASCCDWDDDDDDVAAWHTYVKGWASLLSSSSKLESSMTLLESQVGLALWVLTLDFS